jgi:Na+-driven multidrug efflux pump
VIGETVKENIFVRKAFRSFFLPSLLSCLGVAIGGLADCLFVGNTVGAVGLTAISIGQPVYMLFNTISYSLSIGGSIRYSTALSAGKAEEGNRIFGNVLRLAIFTYLILCALGLLFLPEVLTFLGAGTPGTEIWANCESLVRAQLLLVPVMFCQGPFYYFVNSDNDPKLAAAAFVTSNTLDIVFNYVFVVVMRLGVAGSVYSTGLGAAAMLCISAVHFIRRRGCLRLTWPKFDGAELAKSFKTGFATSVQYIYQFVTILVCNRLLMSLGGNLGVAVFDIVFNVALLAASVYDAISMALQPMVSTFRGERNQDNIRCTLREALKVSLVLSAVLTLILLLIPHWVCFAFGLRDAAELALGSVAVRIYAVGVIFSGINMLMTYYYQAMEKEFASYLLFTLRSFVLFLFFSLTLGQLGFSAFWWTYPGTELGTLLVLAAYNAKKRSWTYLDRNDETVFTALLFSETANLGQVEQAVDGYMERLEASPQQTYYVTMTVEEVCSVILSNAFSRQEGYIQLTIVPHKDGAVTLHLRDNAKRFNPFEMNTEDISLEQGTGLDAIGVKMIKSKAKEFFYRRYAGFNTLVVRI